MSPRKSVSKKHHRESLLEGQRRVSRRKDSASPGVLFQKLVDLQARLRGSRGCPWDREQTHESLRTFLLEETYEVLEAMEGKDPKKFAGELGDLLLQIIFHSLLAEEAGWFGIGDVIDAVHRKMVRRHPHVFGNLKADSAAEVLKRWEKLKAEEREHEKRRVTSRVAVASLLAGVPKTVPASLEAYQLTRRAARIGFDWPDFGGLLEKLEEEAGELKSALDGSRRSVVRGNRGEPTGHSRVEEEVGDLLFVAVNIARFVGVDPEIALKRANRKFVARFEWMEQEAARRGIRLADVPREAMEALWDASKMRQVDREASEPQLRSRAAPKL